MKKKAPKIAKNQANKSKKLADMSVDDFMNSLGDSGSDSGSEDDQDLSPNVKKVVNGSPNGLPKSKIKSSNGDEEDDESELSEEDIDSESECDDEDGDVDEEQDASEGEDIEDDGADEDDSSEVEAEESEGDGEEEDGETDEEDETDSLSEAEGSDVDDTGEKHKKSLSKLKELDPEFYKYLEENDKKLLQFNVSDSEESDEDKDDEGGSDSEVHRPPEKLEVNSDESDYEPDGDDGGTLPKKRGIVSLKMVQKWRESLQNDKTVQTISDVVQAFHAALQRVAPEQEKSACMFKVEGGAVFNAVVQMCVLDLLPAFRRYLGLSAGSLSHINPVKCKRWGKVKTLIRSYSADLLQLLGGIASVSISTIILKHLHQMTPFIICFPNVTKHFLKKMISLWATGEETVRVVAFMCLLRATSMQQKTLLDQVLRHMYMAYVQNTKFVSPTTLPAINFMRRSLSELFLLDENVSYHHAFLYIRQLAIHLRNAITVQKKESIQAVYNWQFISSLGLWVELLGASSKQALQPLIYPVVQVTTGAIKLIPTAQYYPLRFHCIRLLISLSRNTGVFVPVLPFLLEILNTFDFNKKHSKVSMKPLDFSCILRLSKAQQQENGFKDAIIENIYNLILEHLANESHSVAFPDLALPAIIQLRDFLKKCKVANYSRKLRQVLEKLEENSKFVETERKNATFKLSDAKAVEDWETALKVKGTPLGTFFNSWQKMNSAKQTKLKTDAIDITENLPKIVRPTKVKSKSEGPVDLLPSDDSDSDGPGFSDDDDEAPKRKRGKRGKKNSGQASNKKAKVLDEPVDGGDDIVEDVNLAEW